ncbi:acyl-CoA dehydrogenase family protein [Streptomyces natalensis]|uniref:acyl-CoA dehydrogenase family protein n=1 Tax=Streptomyces natalensis TaxID=68242 RepID=UPI0005CA2F9B|nr:acyl-CoA dehydrogenase family protein [Streptomyces natalensis]
MDFTPTEEQTAAQELAARIFGDLATHERLAAAGSGTDAELWKALCAAGLPGAVEEIGLLGLVLLLEEQGRATAQVPFAATCAYGVLAVARHGTHTQRARLLPGLRAGTEVATGAFPARPGVRAEERPGAAARLTGVVRSVPWLREATHVLVADAGRGLWLVRTDDPGVRRHPVETTAPWAAGRLTLDRAAGERLGGPGASPSSQRRSSRGDPYDDVLGIVRTAWVALQAGVCAGALARVVAHTSTRQQFGRPLSANQGVLLRAADAYMDTEAIRVTAYEAAWRRDQGLDAAPQTLTAAWWAAEAGTRVVHAAQHLHGGIGADVDHPVHRHFLWGRQVAGYVGSGAGLLEELGELVGERSDPALPEASTVALSEGGPGNESR